MARKIVNRRAHQRNGTTGVRQHNMVVETSSFMGLFKKPKAAPTPTPTPRLTPVVKKPLSALVGGAKQKKQMRHEQEEHLSSLHARVAMSHSVVSDLNRDAIRMHTEHIARMAKNAAARKEHESKIAEATHRIDTMTADKKLSAIKKMTKIS